MDQHWILGIGSQEGNLAAAQFFLIRIKAAVLHADEMAPWLQHGRPSARFHHFDLAGRTDRRRELVHRQPYPQLRAASCGQSQSLAQQQAESKQNPQFLFHRDPSSVG